MLHASIMKHFKINMNKCKNTRIQIFSVFYFRHLEQNLDNNKQNVKNRVCRWVVNAQLHGIGAARFAAKCSLGQGWADPAPPTLVPFKYLVLLKVKSFAGLQRWTNFLDTVPLQRKIRKHSVSNWVKLHRSQLYHQEAFYNVYNLWAKC